MVRVQGFRLLGVRFWGRDKRDSRNKIIARGARVALAYQLYLETPPPSSLPPPLCGAVCGVQVV